MNPREIIKRAKSTLEAHGIKGVYLRRLDEMTGKEGLIIRLLPITRSDTHFDLSECLQVPYQVIARFRSDSEAFEMCSKAVEILEHCVFPIEGAHLSDQEVYTYPQELEVSESGFYVYEARLTAQVVRY